MDTTFLDARGLNCPLPLLKTRQALRGLAPGALLEVAATDAGSARDIPNYLGQSPHELVRRDENEQEFRFLIRRGKEESD
ncbi:sulfurtransferase TusA family protein [Alloalcanivorax sp. C16-2]|uniref:sulfurtransferase TusA family protein n=1 Tax=Alloalcanivorax TaxID=3020832 RepID=UPI000C492A98|nr:sulfurtransferase TusA family protein [Alloalcanivorax marinus]MAO59858.1 response regulator SirA [Alcanivorax sp.]MAY10179.1 response regulator SirA [Alcanivorax sp.]MBI55177.1 response regulator SirA [Alcanivorax sp.]MBL7250027.1 sulfurtransferase TusA family protein [Alloalcanivorax marinus]HCE40164.1 sulfurtransferase TusA family protein [Alcanivorax sp.]|tara:strand:+ start:669 stop:908 length:240 start_codon:yes stop_codon:yes gene_type:complete